MMTTHLSNPLASPAQLSSSSSLLDGVPPDLETSVRYVAVRLTQAAGILLRLPQDTIAQAIVIYTRFWLGPEGGSLRQYDAKDISAACLYMMAKLSAYPQSPRSVLNVYAYLLSSASPFSKSGKDEVLPSPEEYYLSEGTYQTQRNKMMKMETLVLRTLGFQTHVALPYTLAINYLQALDVFGEPSGPELSQRTFAHLTTALMSPQLLYSTHQPPALATAAIYLAAREVGVKLPSEEWWEVFDVDREELGFLVVGMRSMDTFVTTETEKWDKRKIPLTTTELELELELRRMRNGD
ncbi:MAG: GTP-binding protein Rho1 [Chaenotheca gracillima]|nr:MAG: GTP-binding protein Rho1 [Chaenotheca gracillima]